MNGVHVDLCTFFQHFNGWITEWNTVVYTLLNTLRGTFVDMFYEICDVWSSSFHVFHYILK